MSDKKALTEKLYGEMSQAGDIDTLVETYFTEDFVEHEEVPGLEATGREVPKMMFRMMRQAMPDIHCLLYTSPSPRDGLLSRMPSSA